MGQSSGGGRSGGVELGANPTKYGAAGAKYGFKVASPGSIKKANAVADSGGSSNAPSTTKKVR